MPVTRREAFLLQGYQGAPTDGVVEVVYFDSQDRFNRALKGLGLSWAAAVASILIPVAHFLLVPGLLIFGIVVFFRRLRMHRATVSIRGRCPDCGSEQEYEKGLVWEVPVSLVCGQCGRTLRGIAAPIAAEADSPDLRES